MINHDQAIFDAIAAATDHNDDGIFVDAQKFIDTFNSHRDRKLCTSLDVAQTPPMNLPEIPDNDADFTPDLARKIIAKYQELLGVAQTTAKQDKTIHWPEDFT